MTRSSRTPPPAADPTPDLFDGVHEKIPGRVTRAADIVNPPRAERQLPTPSDWSFEVIEQYHAVIRATAERFGLDTYPNQLEVITAEQMMDAYASVGMSSNRSGVGSAAGGGVRDERVMRRPPPS